MERQRSRVRARSESSSPVLAARGRGAPEGLSATPETPTSNKQEEGRLLRSSSKLSQPSSSRHSRSGSRSASREPSVVGSLRKGGSRSLSGGGRAVATGTTSRGRSKAAASLVDAATAQRAATSAVAVKRALGAELDGSQASADVREARSKKAKTTVLTTVPEDSQMTVDHRFNLEVQCETIEAARQH